MTSRAVTIASGDARDCTVCLCRGAVRRNLVQDSLPYGEGAEAVTLTPIIPVWTCEHCGESYTDFETEEVRHEAICRYLGRPSPQTLRAFRAKFNISQEDFAKITRFGVASVRRWESGAQIPSDSAAQHLELAMDLRTFRRLLNAYQETHQPVFVTSISEATRQQAACFFLRPVRVEAA